ncbi:MAG: LysR family transcriptional regulator [Bacteriovoracaceae bacterium]|nr:LysR family transcriptional regulator [Bacteriovoracaceae bacterium]
MEIELSRIFVKVIQHRSFSSAAEILKLPKSSVSRAISRLELESGTKLIIRTTRSLNLTEAGREFYEACLPAVLMLEEAQRNLEGKDKTISGTIKITAPEDLGIWVISPVIAELSLKHPTLNFEFSFTDSVVDIIKEGFDIAIRLGKRIDSGLKLTQTGDVVLIAVASPKYLAKNEKIKHPNDLKEHTFLSHFWSKQWTMKSVKAVVNVPIKTKITGNNMISIMNMSIAGCGIAFVPRYLCDSHLKLGKLVHVLPEWKSLPISASIITPVSPSSSLKLKTTVTAIQKALNEALK